VSACPGQRVRVGWNKPGTPDNWGIRWQCWAVCDGCGNGQVCEVDGQVATYVDLAERVESDVLAELGRVHTG
jgi:hypothetical protein